MSGSPEAKAALPSQIGGRLAVRGRLLGNAGAEYAKERRSDRGGRSGPRTEASGERTERMPADATQQNTHGLTDYSATLGAPPEGKITRRHPISRWIKSPLLYQLSYRVEHVLREKPSNTGPGCATTTRRSERSPVRAGPNPTNTACPLSAERDAASRMAASQNIRVIIFHHPADGAVRQPHGHGRRPRRPPPPTAPRAHFQPIPPPERSKLPEFANCAAPLTPLSFAT